MTVEVEDFLAHHGIAGMKWGKHKARSDDRSSGTNPKGGGGADDAPKPKMSRNKKIAIAVGVGAVVAIGAAVAISAMNKNMDFPIDSLVKHPSTSTGQQFVAKAHTVIPKEPTGLVLKPSKSTPSAPKLPTTDGNTILGNRLERAGLSPSDLHRKSPPSRPTMPAGPSLNTLSNLINGGPQVVYNPKTGTYETR
jgi:hypothetical protein